MILKTSIVSISNDFVYEKISNERCYLISEDESFCFDGSFHVSIFEKINSLCTVGELSMILGERYPEAIILFELMRLIDKGYINIYEKTNVESSQYNPQRQPFSDKKCTIDISGTDIRSIEAIKDCLMSYDHINFDNTCLVTCNDYLEKGFLKHLYRLCSTNKCVIPIKLSGKNIWIGPIFSKTSPCPYCMEFLLRRNRPVANYIFSVNERHITYVNNLDTLTLTNRASLAIKSLKNLTEIPNSILTIPPNNFTKFSVNPTRCVPQCRKCGDPELFQKQVKQPVTLNSFYHKVYKYGGFRTVHYNDTWNRLKHLICPITGVISYIGPHKDKDHPLRPVWRTTYFVNLNPLYVKKEEIFVRNSLGKGCSAAQARTSALCEAIERSSAQFSGDEPIIRGTFAELADNHPVIPDKLLLYSKKQYATRSPFENASNHQPIPPEYDPASPINWTWAWSITNKRSCLVPLTYCYMFSPYIENECICPFNSNGNAAGNTIEEAVLQGLLELIERDAVAIWWYNRLHRSAIKIENFDDPYFKNVSKHYTRYGYDLWVLDITHDLNVPVMVALAQHKQSKGFFIGMGAHLDISIAVQRAITELHQVFSPDKPQDAIWNESEIENPSYLFPLTYKSPDFAMQSIENSTIADDVISCINKLSEKGLETIVLNYTRPDIAFPTVKVIVPGLRHFWKRLGEGRLYTVPVEMGWLERPNRENEMNPMELTV